MVRAFISIFIFLALIQPINISAQRSEIAEPFSSIYKLSPITQFEEMPTFNVSLMLKEDAQNSLQRTKAQRFAKMIDVAFHPFNSGTWDECGAGKIWRLGLHSKDAYSLYLIFNEFRLVPGVKLYVYNPGFLTVAGAFTNKNNNRFNKFAIAPVDGDAIIIELDVPSGIEDFGKLSLSKVGHDYHNEFGTSKLKAAKSSLSESCEVDINCTQGAEWQKEKRAVCKLIVNDLLCTGTLINNTSNLKIPYLITAYHCVQTEQVAEGGIFYFNYENTSCGGVPSSAQTLFGAELVSTTDHKLDFTLLKLIDYPPLFYQPYFVGWDARSDTPISGVCIHHPDGDVKKISIDTDPLVTGSFGEDFDSLSHWQVQRWNTGATEGGSSGSPIFNAQHRLFGTLTGGSSSCTSPFNDYFTKFSQAWDKYPDSVNQVKYWLDPKKKEISFVNGFDPYNISLGVCDTFWNIPKNEHIQLSNAGLQWGWISGQNSSGVSQFAEKFINHTTIQIPGVFFYVGKAYSSSSFSNITVKIWEGNSYPTTEIYSKKFRISYFKKNAVNFAGFDTMVMAAGNFFVGYEVNYTTPSDTFAIYTSANRGVKGPSTMYVYNNGIWQGIDAASNPALYSSLSIGLVGCDGSVIMPESKDIMVFPNPFTDKAQVDLPEGVTIVKVVAYDYVGRPVPLQYETSDSRLFIYPGNLHSGMYILELRTKSKPLFAKFTLLPK